MMFPDELYLHVYKEWITFALYWHCVFFSFTGVPPDEVQNLRKQLKNLNSELLSLQDTIEQTRSEHPAEGEKLFSVLNFKNYMR